MQTQLLLNKVVEPIVDMKTISMSMDHLLGARITIMKGREATVITKVMTRRRQNNTQTGARKRGQNLPT